MCPIRDGYNYNTAIVQLFTGITLYSFIVLVILVIELKLDYKYILRLSMISTKIIEI